MSDESEQSAANTPPDQPPISDEKKEGLVPLGNEENELTPQHSTVPNSKQDGGSESSPNEGTSDGHREKGFFSADALDVSGGLIFLVFSGEFHLAGGRFHIVGFAFDFLVVVCGLTIITHHAGEQKFRLFGLYYWGCIITAFFIFAFLASFVVKKESKGEPQENGVRSSAVGWLPPELPPGCSNISVSFGTDKIVFPLWVAKMPHDPSRTNYYDTNVFTIQVSSNLTVAVYGSKNLEDSTNEEVVTYPMKDLPGNFVAGAEKMPDYSPRKRHLSFSSQYFKTQIANKSLDFPVWPIVVNNRLFVDVEIPFINEIHRISMDTNFDVTMIKLLPKKWDINYNSNTLEIVTEATNPVLQVIYKSSTEIQVNGVYMEGGLDVFKAFDGEPALWYVPPVIAVSAQSTQQIEFNDFIKRFGAVANINTNVIYDPKITGATTIFKYPSWNYLGEVDPRFSILAHPKTTPKDTPGNFFPIPN